MNYDHEIFPTTQGVSVYISDTGWMVIKQEKGPCDEADQSILISPVHIKMFVKAIQEVARGR